MPEAATAVPASAVERAIAALDATEKPAATPPAVEAPPSEPAKADAAPEPAPAAQEAKAEPAPDPKPKEPTAAERFAAMARKEKQIVERDRSLKDREAKLAEREAAIKAAEDRRQGYSQDPLKALSDLGLTYEDLTKLVLNKTDPSAQQALAMRQLAEQVEQAKREAAAAKEAIARAQAEREAAEKEHTTAAFKGEVGSFLKANAEKYELIEATDSQELVFATVQAEFERTGEMLTLEQAADKVETFLEQRLERVAKAKKLAAKIAPPKPPPAPTLTNAVTPAPPPARPRMTEAERFQAALAALKD